MSFMDYYEGRERERAEAEDGSGDSDIDTLVELFDEDTEVSNHWRDISED